MSNSVPQDLSTLSWGRLEKLCVANGIEVTDQDSKHDLRRKLKKTRNSN